MISVKATHNAETRRLVFEDPRSLTYSLICNEIRRVFPIHGPFCLTNVSVTTRGGAIRALDVYSADDFEAFVRPKLNSRLMDADMLRFSITELGAPPPSRFRSRTAPARSSWSAWRNVTDGPTCDKQEPLSAVVPHPNTNLIETNLNQLEKDFREGEIKFTQAFNALKSEVVRMLAQASSTTAPSASASSITKTGGCGQGPCGGTPKPDDSSDALTYLRIPGAFESSIANTSATPLVPVSTAIDAQMHHNIWCDFCGRAIRGIRAKCNGCEEYDLCEQCILHHDALKKHADRHSHTFSFVPAKTNASNRPTSVAPTSTELASFSSSTKPIISDVLSGAGNENLTAVVHHGIACDLCQETVVGRRNKCLVCLDYDLCEKCLPRAQTAHDPAHAFYVIEQSEFPSGFSGCASMHQTARPAQSRPLPQPRSIVSRVVHEAICDLCDSVIAGTRHKCLDCPDYDVCSACYAIVPEQHPNHVFVTLTTRQNLSSKNPARQRVHYANCDSCMKAIFNVRYKCMHPECPDYDLCEHCEALPIPIHPSTHPLLKMRHPLTVVPTVYRVGGQTLIPEGPRNNAFRCDHYSNMPNTPKSDPLLEKVVSGTFDLSDIADITVVATSAELCSFEKTPQMKPILDLPEQSELAKMDEKHFSLAAELEAPVTSPSPTSVTGRLSLKQMLVDPLVAADEEVRPATNTLLRSLPIDRPSFGLHLKQDLRATFVSNNNVSEGQIFPAGAEFIKTWRMVNDGTIPWPSTTEVMFVAGDRLAAKEHATNRFTVGSVDPGEEVDVSAGELKAPEIPGKYVGYWKLSDGSGRTFGQSMWCEIAVADAESTQCRSLSSSAVIMPGSAPSVTESVSIAATPLAGKAEPSTPTSPSVSSSLPSLNMDSDDSSALLEGFETASDATDWEDIREEARASTIDPEYVVLYDEDHTDDE